MYYFIQAQDGIYGGLHGMNIQAIIEADSDEAACSEGMNMSFDVMESYSEIIDSLRADVMGQLGIEDECDWDDECEGMLGDIMLDDVDYWIWEIDPKDVNFNDLEHEAYDDVDGFINKYGIRPV